jgi:hypothetical protein
MSISKDYILKNFAAILVLGLLLLVSPPAFGLIGAKMLTVEIGARPVGMGGAFTSIGGDPFSVAYNPAACWGIERLSGSVGYSSHLANSRIENGYVVFKKRSMNIFAGVNFAAVDNLEGRQFVPTSDFLAFDAHDVSVKFGTSFELEKNYFLGFSLGWINEKIDTYSDFAFNFDVGLLVTPHPNVSVGLAILNFGSTLNLRDEAYDIPTTYRGGVSYKYHDLTVAGDLVRIEEDMYEHFGAEYHFRDMFFVRAGYRAGYDTKNFSAGVGFTKRNLRIDYAFLPYTDYLGTSHLFNLTFHL